MLHSRTLLGRKTSPKESQLPLINVVTINALIFSFILICSACWCLNPPSSVYGSHCVVTKANAFAVTPPPRETQPRFSLAKVIRWGVHNEKRSGELVVDKRSRLNLFCDPRCFRTEGIRSSPSTGVRHDLLRLREWFFKRFASE